MHSIIDFYAKANTPFIHANGKSGTAFLLKKMNPTPGKKILEIGFGTGQTLLEIACRFPGVELFGLEKSPEMLAAAERRFLFSGEEKVSRKPMPDNLEFPFPENFFDIIYCESVLSILEDGALDKILSEISRTLRPGGELFFNESLWRVGVPMEKIERINGQCREWFGIPQASAKFPFPEDWRRLLETNGFSVLETVHLEGIRPELPFALDSRLFRARLFSIFGKLKSVFSPELSAWKKGIAEREAVFSEAGKFLEGIFFHTKLSE